MYFESVKIHNPCKLSIVIIRDCLRDHMLHVLSPKGFRMVETLVYNIYLYVEVNSYKVSIQCPNFLISSISQVTVHIFSWWSWSWHQELTLLGRWFSRWSPWPQETRSGSRAAWTIVSPPCSGVFITNLEHMKNYQYNNTLPKIWKYFSFEINRQMTGTSDLSF